jgi:glycerophosphoryl diester phosphodiesterase
MPFFEIVAYRGVPSAEAPENTIPSYQYVLIDSGKHLISVRVLLIGGRPPTVFT